MVNFIHTWVQELVYQEFQQLIEHSHDKDGIIWNKTFSPFCLHLINLCQMMKPAMNIVIV